MKITTQFESAIAEITDVPSGDFSHPFLTKIKFIFADNQGNANAQGIEEEDFDGIIKSSIHMPIKIRYTHSGAGGHDMAIPIGHITSMIKSSNEDRAELHGEALLYNEEFPDEIDYLKQRHAEGQAPGISWELAYQDAVQKNGINWLKGAITRAATFVKFPAYGSRTALLAIAERQGDAKFIEALQTLINDWASEDNIDKGGMNVDELEKLQKELAEALAKITELETKLAESETKVEEATATITILTDENNTFKKTALISERTTKLVEAGVKVETDQEKLAQKQEIWLAMSPESFDMYVSDLAAASKSTGKTAEASSKKKDSLPKFAVAGTEEISIDDLKAVGRRASRGDLADL